MNYQLMLGDCLERMKEIQDGSVDMILTDPPYGTTACKWDSVIPLDSMWNQLKRIIKPNGAIVMTASQPFTTALIGSNLKQFRYCWVWEKNIASNFAFSKYGVMKFHEDVCVFYSNSPTYNPQMTKGKPNNPVGKGIRKNDTQSSANTRIVTNKTDGIKHPKSVIRFNRETGCHPTQKPVALMEYLIKTYTNEDDTVLDFTMGSGTTGVACINTGRQFIGIEKELKYYQIAEGRIGQALLDAVTVCN